jgi:hypothetical protein
VIFFLREDLGPKDEEDRSAEAQAGPEIIQGQFLLQIEQREGDKDHEGDDLLRT